MAKTGAIPDISRERGQPPTEIVKDEVEKTGSILAAALSLKVAPNTIRYWLKKGNFTVSKSANVIQGVQS
jgi:hypothetical protein